MRSVVAAILSASTLAVPHVDPAFAQNITVYHVNSKSAGAVPVNMDTGNAPGDLYFDLLQVIIYPLICPHGARSGNGCRNPEISGDLNVNKVTLEVDRRFSQYAKCNVCVSILSRA